MPRISFAQAPAPKRPGAQTSCSPFAVSHLTVTFLISWTSCYSCRIHTLWQPMGPFRYTTYTH